MSIFGLGLSGSLGDQSPVAIGSTPQRYVDVSDLNAIEDQWDWLSGLGQLRARPWARLPPVRAPLDRGYRFRRRLDGLAGIGLGLVTGTGRFIPDSCFDDGRFIDCANVQYGPARKACEGDAWKRLGYRDVFACEADQHDVATINVCVPKYCGDESTGEAAIYPWRQYSSDTEDLQRALNLGVTAVNEHLAPEEQLCPVVVDGKLGPSTCGQLRAVLALHPQAVGEPPITCNEFASTAICPGGEAPPPPPPPPGPSPCPAGQRRDPETGACVALAPPPSGDRTSRAALWALGIFAALGLGAYALTRKKGRRG